MDLSKNSYKTIDEYIVLFPKDVQIILQELRTVIRKELPKDIEETISYGIPTFKLNGKYVVYFAGYKQHISIHPILEEIQNSIPEVSEYKKGRGTLQFSLNKPLPYPLIRKIVQFLLIENQKRTGK